MPTNNSINTPKPIDVPNGGTGQSTLTTANGILAAGTTATGAIQNIGTGSAGQVLTSNGTGLPSFQAAGGGGGDVVLLSSQDLAGVNSVTFNSFINNTVYASYIVKFYANGVTGNNLVMQISTDNGVTFLATGYNTSSGQFNPPFGFFNWVTAAGATESTLNTFFGTEMTQQTLELLPFGENLTTTVLGYGSFWQGSYPGLIWSSFQHSTTNANAFKLYTSGGANWTAGRASLYGYKK